MVASIGCPSTGADRLADTRALHSSGLVGDPSEDARAARPRQHVPPRSIDLGTASPAWSRRTTASGGGCWCMGLHPEGLARTSAVDNRTAKRAHVAAGSVTRCWSSDSPYSPVHSPFLLWDLCLALLLPDRLLTHHPPATWPGLHRAKLKSCDVSDRRQLRATYLLELSKLRVEHT
jgi:hypothetical protein